MRSKLAVLLPAVAALALPALAQAPALPKHPDALTFPPLTYEPPEPAGHRVVLKNGMVVYIAEDRALPLVQISLQMRWGGWLVPEGQEGLAGLVAAQMRRGGAGALSAEALDERLDFLAAQVSVGASDTGASANLNALADNLDESLALFVAILKEPRFQQDRLDLAREQMLQEMKKRNDDAADIEAAEWSPLLYGEGHVASRFTTEASIKALDRAALLAFHKRWVHPGQMVAAVSGAFDRKAMIAKLESAFAKWPTARPDVPPVPKDISPAAPGVYRVQKDVNQGRVSIGLPGVMRGDPDVYALEVMNEILGGSGFTSRITRTVRSNEGLAYSAGSSLSFGVYYPGRFRAAFQSKSPTVAYATSLVFDEIRKLREQGVTAEELESIKANLVATFPSNFESKARAMSVFAADEFTKRAPGFWKTYRDRIRAVTAEDVKRVAQKHLVPEKMIVLVVGDQAAIDKGDDRHPVKLEALAPGGKVVTLPMRDPMTMKR